MVSVPACHEPADPAPQYASLLEGITAPRPPSFDAPAVNKWVPWCDCSKRYTWGE
jgi:hypothetical protein